MIDRRSLVVGLLASAFAPSGAGAHHTKPKSSRKLKPRRVSFACARVRGPAGPVVVASSALKGFMAPPSELGLEWNPELYGI